jgi:hypothetical protein
MRAPKIIHSMGPVVGLGSRERVVTEEDREVAGSFLFDACSGLPATIRASLSEQGPPSRPHDWKLGFWKRVELGSGPGAGSGCPSTGSEARVLVKRQIRVCPCGAGSVSPPTDRQAQKLGFDQVAESPRKMFIYSGYMIWAVRFGSSSFLPFVRLRFCSAAVLDVPQQAKYRTRGCTVPDDSGPECPVCNTGAKEGPGKVRAEVYQWAAAFLEGSELAGAGGYAADVAETALYAFKREEAAAPRAASLAPLCSLLQWVPMPLDLYAPLLRRCVAAAFNAVVLMRPNLLAFLHSPTP